MRNKWNKDDVRQLKLNDLVWVVDENVKRSNYKMARVVEVQEGSDGRVRSATVVTKDGKLKRPVVKLAPLFYESVFQEKNRAGNVGASHQKAEKFDSEHMLVEKQNLNSLKLRWNFEPHLAKSKPPQSGFSLQLLTLEPWNLAHICKDLTRTHRPSFKVIRPL